MSIKEAKIKDYIYKGIYKAGLKEAPPLPTSITRAEFAELCATSPVNQLLSLLRQSKTRPNLKNLTVSQVLTNTRGLESLIDKAFIRL